MKNVSRDVRYLWRCEPGQALEASEHAHSTKEIGRLCFYLVLVWAENRKILPYAKSDRHQRSLWSRLAETKVREDSQHDQLSACTVRALRAYFHILFYVNHARALTTPAAPFFVPSAPFLRRRRLISGEMAQQAGAGAVLPRCTAATLAAKTER